ncbi:Uma2 family endonuclease [Corallococcus sp. AB049A]|uniref:Uma2 family endonuclease n=1 Tax=Corallococcus interemptor TaxID=2316720 RepID=A0A3A8Q6Q6_9BACT|nr:MULTISPECIES: Uma2 family endonuclease [Corallococcus]RKH40822.1 Uma2 family endonuclease [Corallococcus sp. AB050B]RKH64336.1 Uma2 family endonuclease [Corallococcus interemptor]RKI59562.1 Uma2 family endonuclease [Corallococcus sp. AB049A]
MTRKPATYADLEALPSNQVGEIVNGELYASPRPANPHASAAWHLGGELYGPFERGRGGPGGWLILSEPELHLGKDVLVPDLAGWRRERLSKLSKVVGIQMAPDWLCEVLSPSTSRLDRVRKLPIYAREGVKHVWLVDPREHMLEVYRLEGGHYLLLGAYGDAETVHAEPFEALPLELKVLWEDVE